MELLARVSRYQRDVLRALARREGTLVDAVLRRELEDVARSYREELLAAVPELTEALACQEGTQRERIEEAMTKRAKISRNGSSADRQPGLIHHSGRSVNGEPPDEWSDEFRQTLGAWKEPIERPRFRSLSKMKAF